MLDAKGAVHEQVYDVAWSGQADNTRKPGANGKLPPVGNTVDVAGNLFLGREPRRPLTRLIDHARMHREARAVLELDGMHGPSAVETCDPRREHELDRGDAARRRLRHVRPSPAWLHSSEAGR